MNLDINALASETWKQFTAKPAEHILVGLAFGVLALFSLGILVGPLYVGWLRMCEKQRRGENIQVGDLFQGFDAFGPAFACSVLMLIGLVIGFAMFIVPGFVLLAAWTFAYHFIALRGQGGLQALGSSWRLFRAQLGPVLTTFVLVMLVAGAGGTIFPAGLLTTPLTVIFTNLVFQQLTAQAIEPPAA